MKNMGETLREAREERGLSLEAVSKETNIVEAYLDALEKENFSVFPSKTYAMGFLRNYGDFLGLDTAELLSQFHSLEVVEDNKALEALLTRPKHFPRWLIVLIVVVVLGGGGTGLWFYAHRPAKRTSVNAATQRNAQSYEWDADTLNERFYVGDKILAKFNNEIYELNITGINNAVHLSTPAGELTLQLNVEKQIDLNNDGTVDCTVIVSDFAPNNPAMGAQLRFQRPESKTEAAAAATGANNAAAQGIQPAVNLPGSQQSNPQVTIFNAVNAYPFTIRVSFQGYCLFRWEILREANRKERTENYFSKGQDVSIQAQNGVRVWTSNAATARLQVIGGGQTVPVNLGTAGEVVVADIQWVRDDSGRFKLVLQRLDN
jgi:cytoskeletal protein RodZ